MKRLALTLCLSLCALAQAQLTISPAGNARVPSNAPIQPPQAFVDHIAQFATTTTGVSGLTGQITSVDPTFLAAVVTNWFAAGSATTVDLSGKAIVNVDAILTALNASCSNLNIAGGTNVVPTPVSAPVDAIIQLTFPDSPVSSAPDYDHHYLDLFYGEPLLYRVAFDDTLPLSASAFASSGGNPLLLIGISDTPTKQQIATKVVALNIAQYGEAVDNHNGSVVLHVENEYVEPAEGITASDSSSGVTFSSIQNNAPFSPNADITTRLGNGLTTTVNEYVDRVSGATEVVTYAP